MIMKTNKIKLHISQSIFNIVILAVLTITSFASYGHGEEGGDVKKFNFSSAPEVNTETVDKALVAPHYLGEEVAVLSYLVRKTYITKRTDASGSGYTDTAKPAIYHAVLDINKLFKKAVKKGTYTSQEAGEIYSDCLRKSYSLFYVETQELEKLMSEMQTLEQYIALYNCISFE